MKTKHFISFFLFLILLCSCSGMSESKALRIANKTSGFNESLYRLIIIDDHWCLSDSSYVNEGNGHVTRVSNCEWDVHKPEFRNCYSTEWMDTNSDQIILDASIIGLQYSQTPHRCDGCIQCYEKYAQKGLITLKVIDENEGGQTQRVSISLTEMGKKYLLETQEKDKEHVFWGKSHIGVKMGKKVYTSIKEINEGETKARYLFEYYIEYTPWAEALGYTTNKKKIYRERVSFEKQEGDWKILQKEGIEPGSYKRTF